MQQKLEVISLTSDRRERGNDKDERGPKNEREVKIGARK